MTKKTRKNYSRKVDNGCAIQIIEVTDGKFSDISFIEDGNGSHSEFIPKGFKIGQKMVRGFLKNNGFHLLSVTDYYE